MNEEKYSFEVEKYPKYVTENLITKPTVKLH